NPVVLHEAVERLAGDAPEPGSRHAEPLELPVVEATDNGLLADLADFSGLAGRENGLHTFVHPLLAWGQSHECGPANVSPRDIPGPKSSLIRLLPVPCQHRSISRSRTAATGA